MITLSYIIPTYNNLNLLKRCINSILTQLDKGDQIIIIDDGSTDGTVEFLKNTYKDNNEVLILQQQNSGSGKARNFGVENSRSDYIWFVDSDDFLEKNASKKLKKC